MKPVTATSAYDRPLIPRDQEVATVIPRDQRSSPQSIGSDPKGGSVIPRDQRSTFRIEVRMRVRYQDCENILANWRIEKQQAPKLAAAIRLMNAIDAGNLDYVRENHPQLVAALQQTGKSRKQTRAPLYIDSYSSTKEDSESVVEDLKESEERAMEELETAIEEVTGVDRRLSSSVRTLAKQLHRAKYTADDVRDWYARYWRQEWPGSKGDMPTLNNLRMGIGRLHKQPQLPPMPAALPPAQDCDPIPDEPPVDDAPGQVDEVVDISPLPPLRPTLTRGWGVSEWCKLMMQMQGQLNRATVDAHLQRIRLLEAQEGDPPGFTIAVPNIYTKDWINQNLLPAMRAELSIICLRLERGKPIEPERLVTIKMEMDSDG